MMTDDPTEFEIHRLRKCCEDYRNEVERLQNALDILWLEDKIIDLEILEACALTYDDVVGQVSYRTRLKVLRSELEEKRKVGVASDVSEFEQDEGELIINFKLGEKYITWS